MGRSPLFFFFQAEDGIRDLYVTGVQTCALPISPERNFDQLALTLSHSVGVLETLLQNAYIFQHSRHENENRLPVVGFSKCRSEERRVGKECRCGLWVDLWKEICERGPRRGDVRL